MKMNCALVGKPETVKIRRDKNSALAFLRTLKEYLQAFKELKQ